MEAQGFIHCIIHFPHWIKHMKLCNLELIIYTQEYSLRIFIRSFMTKDLESIIYIVSRYIYIYLALTANHDNLFNLDHSQRSYMYMNTLFETFCLLT